MWKIIVAADYVGKNKTVTGIKEPCIRGYMEM